VKKVIWAGRFGWSEIFHCRDAVIINHENCKGGHVDVRQVHRDGGSLLKIRSRSIKEIAS